MIDKVIDFFGSSAGGGGVRSILPTFARGVYDMLTPEKKNEADKEINETNEKFFSKRKALAYTFLPPLLKKEDSFSEKFLSTIDNSLILRSLFKLAGWGKVGAICRYLPVFNTAYKVFDNDNPEEIEKLIDSFPLTSDEKREKLKDSASDVKAFLDYLDGNKKYNDLVASLQD